jgi:hypothetical protein
MAIAQDPSIGLESTGVKWLGFCVIISVAIQPGQIQNSYVIPQFRG